MTPDQKNIITNSWAQITPIADQVVETFYGRLFADHPDVAPLFGGVDMANQKKKLLQALGMVVGSLDRLDTVVPKLEEMGRRHVGYGVKDEHYDAVGGSLLAALETHMGDAWSDDAKVAWTEAYGVVAGVMKSAA